MVESIVKTLYLNAKYGRDARGKTEKIRDDALLYVVARSDGTRALKMKKCPEYKFYVSKKDLGYHRFSVPIEDVDPIVCKYANRHDEMAKIIGISDQFKQAKSDWKTKRDWISRNIYGNSRLYRADLDIEDAFKLEFNEKNGDHTADIEYRTSFMDIETRADLGDFDQHKAVVPICSICHLDSSTKTIYVNVLRDPLVTMIDEVFGNLAGFVDYMNDYLQIVRNEAMVAIKADNGNPDSIDDFMFSYKFCLVDNEADLIKAWAYVLNITSPDFCACWGINYDMNMIKNRAAKLGLDMAELFSDNLVPPEYKYFAYIEDRDRHEPGSQTHYSRYVDKILTSSKTQLYCQMSLHSNLRRRFLEENYKLDTMGEKYAYIKKVDLKAEGVTIKNAYTKNFRVFLKYAIVDVIVQYMIERANGDIPRYMISCKDSRFTHGTKKTIGIKNELAIFLKESKGHIIGNNKVYDISEPVPGAIIASPNLIEKKGMNIMGVDTHIYENCVDFDVEAEYPSIYIAYNILKTTIYGRITMIYFARDIGDSRKINVPISDGATFNKMLETIDTSIFDIGEKYFGLPGVDDILAQIEKSCLKAI